jgi:hypothetical protein
MALTKAHNRMIEGAAVNVKDFGAVGDGVADDTVAIQAAIDSNYKVIIFPYTTQGYRTTSTLTVSTPSVSLQGQNVTITADHTSGAVIHFKRNNWSISGFTITASTSRQAGSRASNYGVYAESEDGSGNSVANGFVSNVFCANQPNHGFLGIGTVEACTIIDSQFNNNGGHGICFDGGYETSRVNKSSPGQVNIFGCKVNGNGGHGICVGHKDDLTTVPYRFTIRNVDTGTSATDSAVRLTADNNFIRGENIIIECCGLGGDNATGGTEDLGSVAVAGRQIRLINNRYINCATAVNVRQYSVHATSDVVIDQLRVISTGPNLDPAVVVESGAVGVSVRDQYGGNIDSLCTSGVADSVIVDEGNNVIEVDGYHQKYAFKSTDNITLNTDTVATIGFTGSAPYGMVIVASNTSAAQQAIVAYRSGSSNFTTALAATSNFDVTTGVLTGTTGTSGKVTLSTHTDGNMYLENRTAGTRTFSLTFVSQGAGLFNSVS